MNTFIRNNIMRATRNMNVILRRLVSATARARGIFQQKNIRALYVAIM